MRILQVRLKNLNSLAGEWRVDLTHPDYAADGIFAITGPTGAGKSPLLDAICLALYGETPRLGPITQSSNAIMSRHTGECFAEVVFAIDSGTYTCYWGQKRARGRGDGRLQNRIHELSLQDTGAILAEAKNVPDRVAAITGLDFDRFTRSMLLAQGGFAVFLQADAEKRALLLEELTGTHIYAALSRQVHERHGMAKKEYEALQAALAGIAVLSQEEEGLLGAEEQALAGQIQAMAESVAACTQQHGQLVGLESLRRELQGLAQKRALLDARILAFGPRQAQLDKARQALELDASHTALESLRQTRTQTGQQLETCLALLPERTGEAHLAGARALAARTGLAEKRLENQKFSLVLQRVGIMDAQLQDRAKTLAAMAANRRQADEAFALAEKRAKTLQEKVAEVAEALGQTRAFLEANTSDAPLQEDMAAFRQREHELAALLAAMEGRKKTWHSAEASRNEALSARNNALQGVENAAKAEAVARSGLEANRAKLAELSQDRGLEALRERRFWLRNCLQLLETALEQHRAIATLREKSRSLAAQQHEAGLALPGIEQRIHFAAEQRKTTGQLLESLEKRLDMARQMASLEEHRASLVAGQPCPLCGATEHPLVHEELPQSAGLQKELEEVRRTLAALDREALALEGERARSVAASGQYATLLAEAETAQEALLARFQTSLAALHKECGLEEELLPFQERQQAALQEELHSTECLLEQVEGLEAAMPPLAEALDRAREGHTTAHSQAQKAEGALAAATVAAHHAARELAGAGRFLHDAAQGWNEAVAVYSVPEVPWLPPAVPVSGGPLEAVGPGLVWLETGATGLRDSVGNALMILEKRSKAWKEALTLREQQEKTLLDLQRDFQAAQEEGLRLALGLEEEDGKIGLLEQEYQSLATDRLALFGERDVAVESRRMQAEAQDAEKAVERANEAEKEAQAALATLEGDRARLGQGLASATEAQNRAEVAFAARLPAAGFADEAAYRLASLGEEERKGLAAEELALQREQAELSLAVRDREERLLREEERLHADTAGASLETLAARLAGLQDALRLLHEKSGAITQQLAHNRAVCELRAGQVEAIRRQGMELANWAALQKLIGSHDGKKYRNYTQGLTFRAMVTEANRQLVRMTDRYVLVPDKENALNLNVLDSYQAGVERTVQNLSGGETFLVSLALALGLSGLASRNVRVDSLFLDEGFGSLDAEALDTALEALSTLPGAGKLIGVISHVPALQERIGTQIQVVPLSGGRSMLSGPGVGQNR